MVPEQMTALTARTRIVQVPSKPLIAASVDVAPVHGGLSASNAGTPVPEENNLPTERIQFLDRGPSCGSGHVSGALLPGRLQQNQPPLHRGLTYPDHRRGLSVPVLSF